MKDKTDRLLDAVECPESFSEEELRELLYDPEMRTLYELMSKTSDALSESPVPDIEAEWHQFSDKYVHHNSWRNSIGHAVKRYTHRNIAATVIWVLASLGVAAAVGVGIKYSVDRSGDTMSPKETTKSVTNSPVSTSTEEKDTVKVAEIAVEDPRTIVFKGEDFGTIIDAIANRYGAKVNYRNEKVKELRLYYQWDQSLSLQKIVEGLNNFEQINIKLTDNNITIE